MKNRLMASNGSIQDFPDIPTDLKDLYKTVWEISQKVIIDMAADRGAYICQSQSMNLFVENPNFGKLSSMHFYAWQKGLKTGMYYLRSKAATDPIKFTVNQEANKMAITAAGVAAGTITEGNAGVIEADLSGSEGQACNLDDPDCLMCGS